MRANVHALSAVLVLAGLAGAQGRTVVPPANAALEGSSLEVKPFASNRIRMTQLLDASLVKVPFGRMITELGYRRDKTAFPTLTLRKLGAAPAWSVRLGNLRIRTAADRVFDPRNPIGRFMSPGTGALNTLAQVYNAVTSFPALPPVTGPIGPFLIRFKLQRPFVYNGPDGLAIDHFAFATVNRGSNYVIDAERRAIDPGRAVNFGASCPSGKNRGNVIPSNPGGDPLSILLFDGPAQSIAVAAIGASNTVWGPFRLPLDLGPAGLRGCKVFASLDLLLPVATFSNGSAAARLRIPEDAALAGLRFFTQWMVVDSRVNPTLPLAFSNGTDVTLGKTVGKVGLPASFVYGVGGLARSRFGLVDKGVAVVTEIVWR